MCMVWPRKKCVCFLFLSKKCHKTKIWTKNQANTFLKYHTDISLRSIGHCAVRGSGLFGTALKKVLHAPLEHHPIAVG